MRWLTDPQRRGLVVGFKHLQKRLRPIFLPIFLPVFSCPFFRALGVEALRAVRTLAIIVAALAALSLLAAWLVPALLDWNRYRDSIGAIAASRLGRPVVIGGDISVRLFPEAVVTASNVTLPDRGDGISAQLGALRLQVALRPLLAGRIVARDLVLGAPVLHLPWPLPSAIANPPRPLVPAGFNARLEDGVLAIGGAQFTGINATLRSDLVTGALAANGSLLAAGHPWRFQGRLDAANASDGAPITLHVRGDGALRANAGNFAGRLSDASLTGTVDAKGDDFDHALPALPGGWTARSNIALSRGKLEASGITINSVGASAHANGIVSLEGQPRLTVQIDTPHLDAAWWWPVVSQELFTQPGSAKFPFSVDLSAGECALLGDTLHHAHLAVSGDGENVRLTRAEAEPPGGGSISLSGELTHGDGGFEISGPLSVETQQTAKLLAWLHPAAPSIVDAASALAAMQPDKVDASLKGRLALSSEHATMTGIDGSVAGQTLTGDVAVSGLQNSATSGAARPRLDAHLQFENIVLDRLVPVSFQSAVSARRNFGTFDADMHVSAATAQLGTADFSDLVIDAHNDADGLAVRRAAAELGSTHLSASGTLASGLNETGWAIGSGKIAVTTQDAAALRDNIPTRWRFAPSLWKGAADAELSVSGPSDALNLQLSGNEGDLRVEAETLADATAGTATTTLTLRHPGAPRFLSDLGVGHAETWLGTGSMALLLHAATAPGKFTIQDFGLTAADLRLHGRADLAEVQSGTTLDAHVDADWLALPGAASWQELRKISLFPAGWDDRVAGKLHLSAVDVSVGGQAWGRDLATTLSFDQGMMLADPLTANVLGGTLKQPRSRSNPIALHLRSACAQISQERRFPARSQACRSTHYPARSMQRLQPTERSSQASSPGTILPERST